MELLFSIHSDCPCHRVSYRRPAGEKFFHYPVFANAIFFQLGFVCRFVLFRHWAMRKYWIPLLLITIIPLIHNAHQHYSYLFLSFMMFAVLWGGVTEYLYSAKKSIFIIVGITTAFISTAGMFNWIPSMTKRLVFYNVLMTVPYFCIKTPYCPLPRLFPASPPNK